MVKWWLHKSVISVWWRGKISVIMLKCRKRKNPGRLSRCQWDQRNLVSIRGVQSWRMDFTVKNMKWYIVVTDQAVENEVTTADGRKQGNDSCSYILCVSGVRKKDGLWKQPLWITSSLIGEIRSCFGMKATGSHFVSLVMTKRLSRKMWTLSTVSDMVGGFKSLEGVQRKTGAPSNANFRRIKQGG